MRQLVRLACTVAALLASGCVNLDGVTEDPQSPFQGKGTREEIGKRSGTGLDNLNT